MLNKRKILFGDYDTAAHGWTLTGCVLSPAEQKTNYVDKPGGDGTWDLSTALTDGLPRYNDRTLTATLECSEGDRLSREATISEMVNKLDGMRVDIELPDDPDHHVNGRIHVARDYNDLSHAAVTVTAICKPWRYSNTETVFTAPVGEHEALVVRLFNNGRLAVVPTIEITGANAQLTLGFGGKVYELSVGTYKWPDLLLTPGGHSLGYDGYGGLTIKYREAVL